MFSEADVAKAQEEITHDYQNKGWEVEQVSLIKDSDRQYVRLREDQESIRDYPNAVDYTRLRDACHREICTVKSKLRADLISHSNLIQ